MSILYFFESIRNPVLDTVMLALTKLAEEYVFIVAALLVFWCINKKNGYYMMTVGLVGITLNQWLKILFRVPRPWVIDPNFKPVEAAVPAANDYSFPSGHTQNAVGTYGSVERFTRFKWLRIVSIVLIPLIAVSRLYLGVHSLTDVLVSLAVGIVLVFLLYPLIKKTDEKPWIFGVILGVCSLLMIGFLVFAAIRPFGVSADWETKCLDGAMTNVSKMLGATLGMLLSWFLDLKFIKFETKASLPAQIIKVGVGVGVVLGLKALFKLALFALLGQDNIAALIIEYFLVIVVAATLVPMTFKPLNKLFAKKSDSK